MKIKWYERNLRKRGLRVKYHAVQFDDFEEYGRMLKRLTDNLGHASSRGKTSWTYDNTELVIGFHTLPALLDNIKNSRVVHVFVKTKTLTEKHNKLKEFEEWINTTFPEGGCIFNRGSTYDYYASGAFVFLDDTVETLIRLRWSEEVSQ